MTEVLNKLNIEEFYVINLIKTLVGSMESIECQLKKMDVPEKYKYIYNGYNNYYKKSGNVEAFKRLIFIQWYGASEPLAFTGIGELDAKLESVNLKILANLMRTNSVDEEFKNMILHYYSISDWYFDSHFNFLECIGSISKNHHRLDFELPFNNRGQMGEYWNAIGLKRNL